MNHMSDDKKEIIPDEVVEAEVENKKNEIVE